MWMMAQVLDYMWTYMRSNFNKYGKRHLKEKSSLSQARRDLTIALGVKWGGGEREKSFLETITCPVMSIEMHK